MTPRPGLYSRSLQDGARPLPTDTPPSARSNAVAAAIWIALAALAAAGFYWAVKTGALSWSSAVQARLDAAALIDAHPVAAIAAYIAVFVLASLLLFPAQLWIILFGAVLLGFARGFAASWAAAVISGILVFLLARSTVGAIYRRSAQRYLARLESAFREDQFFYMLTLRLIPVCPYCIANIVPAVLGARLLPYLFATMLGVAPYVAIYSFVGARAGDVLDPAHPPDVASLSREILPAALAFASLPIIAILVRRMARRKPA